MIIEKECSRAGPYTWDLDKRLGNGDERNDCKKKHRIRAAALIVNEKDEEGEYYHLVTLWQSTVKEVELYEKNVL